MGTQGEKYLWTDYFSKKNESEITVISTLKRNRLFKRLTQKEYEYVSKVIHVRHFSPHEVVFSQYEKGLGMYMIAKGAIEIRVKSPNNLESADPGNLVTTLNEGSFFGELALIDDEAKRTATAIATTPSTLLGFFKPDLMEIIERKPGLGVKILLELSQVLGRRLTETTEQISRIKSESMKSKS